MSTLSRAAVAGWAVNAALGIAPVGAMDASSVGTGDEAMTCEQIAAELFPYVQQIAPDIQALATTQQQLYEQGRQRSAQRRAEEALLTPLAQAGSVDPTGASKRAYQAALMAQTAKERREDEALVNSPLANQTRARRSSSRRRASRCNPTRACSA